jgi:aspartate/methionine/tyrosine aminotransferase
MIVLNTPHNPVGKVFMRTEIKAITDIAKEFNLFAMSDEVVRVLNPAVSAQSDIPGTLPQQGVTIPISRRPVC